MDKAEIILSGISPSGLTPLNVFVYERMVFQEIRNASLIFDRGGFTILNVSNKPIETSANEILNIMANWFKYRGRILDSPYPAKDE